MLYAKGYWHKVRLDAMKEAAVMNCAMCDGRIQKEGMRIPRTGPNEAGNYEHDGSLCLSTVIWRYIDRQPTPGEFQEGEQ